MLSYRQLKTKPRTLLSLTSLHPSEFEALLPSFEAAWQAYLEAEFIHNRPRQRRYGGGRRSVLHAVEDKLLFILMYFKVYPLQEVQGLFFGLSQAQANEWIHRLTPVLRQALGYEKQLPQRQPRHLEQVLSECVSLEFFIDGTERRIQRPQDPERQRLNYSGKKKAHTRKNLLITDAKRRVHFLSRTREGKKHDKSLADEENYTFPDHSTLYQDTGFQGYLPKTSSGTASGASAGTVRRVQPKKKPRGGELSEDEKAVNRQISKVRITVEHAINGVKRCRIVKDILRNYGPAAQAFDDLVMETACGLHNFRTDKRTVTS